VSSQIENAETGSVIRPASRLRLRIGYRSDRPVKRPQLVVTISDHLDVGLFLMHSED